VPLPCVRVPPPPRPPPPAPPRGLSLPSPTMAPLRVPCLLLCATLVRGLTLPRATIAVAGANGRVGSMVCRELLRNHPLITVRALVRSASDPYQGYGRLSYEVGAEDGKMSLDSAFSLGGGGRFAAPATIEFDEEVQGSYGLDRLEIRECEVRASSHPRDGHIQRCPPVALCLHPPPLTRSSTN
jgi:hypothetical protein